MLHNPTGPHLWAGSIALARRIVGAAATCVIGMMLSGCTWTTPDIRQDQPFFGSGRPAIGIVESRRDPENYDDDFVWKSKYCSTRLRARILCSELASFLVKSGQWRVPPAVVSLNEHALELESHPDTYIIFSLSPLIVLVGPDVEHRGPAVGDIRFIRQDGHPFATVVLPNGFQYGSAGTHKIDKTWFWCSPTYGITKQPLLWVDDAHAQIQHDTYSADIFITDAGWNAATSEGAGSRP